MVGSSITIENACEATMKTSDNTAANIVLKHIGGPQGVTAFLRLIGDKVTQLDRFEPELNQAKADDLRDTTTPNAMNKTLYHILFEDVLAQNSKNNLRNGCKGTLFPILYSVLFYQKGGLLQIVLVQELTVRAVLQQQFGLTSASH
nr:serine hydrolase [Pseudoalteromonas agarivorans]